MQVFNATENMLAVNENRFPQNCLATPQSSAQEIAHKRRLGHINSSNITLKQYPDAPNIEQQIFAMLVAASFSLFLMKASPTKQTFMWTPLWMRYFNVPLLSQPSFSQRKLRLLGVATKVNTNVAHSEKREPSLLPPTLVLNSSMRCFSAMHLNSS